MRQIGNYTVDDTPIGVGGMGQVLRGLSPDGIPVAIKEILPQFVTDEEFRYRIESEVEFLKELNNSLPADNSGVVKVYESFELDSRIYIVMQLVEGQNLEQVVSEQGALPFSKAVRYMLRILDIMQNVHEAGVIHRDIKPGNIMLSPSGEDLTILDFGVAKRKTFSNGTSRTVIGTVIGTNGYMSPEQAHGLSLDSRTDIYSLGCVFFYLLTGHHAFPETGNEIEMGINITSGEFPRLSKYVSSLPSGLQHVLDKSVDKNMLKRYQSCREFRLELMKVGRVGTDINRPYGNREISISIGRENCDLCVGFDNYKVSRHHADVAFAVLDKGPCYVFTDCSSNGSTVNGTSLHKGMSYTIGVNESPTVILAADPPTRLDWNEVRRVLDARIPADIKPVRSDSFFSRLKRMFKK